MTVKKVTMNFPPSPSADTVGYKLYVQKEPDAVSFDSQVFDIGNTTTLDLGTLMVDADGVFNIGVTAYDDAGNESAMSILNGVALDFVQPDPPGAITITRI
jgi:hypothetical protein